MCTTTTRARQPIKRRYELRHAGTCNKGWGWGEPIVASFTLFISRCAFGTMLRYVSNEAIWFHCSKVMRCVWLTSFVVILVYRGRSYRQSSESSTPSYIIRMESERMNVRNCLRNTGIRVQVLHQSFNNTYMSSTMSLIW